MALNPELRSEATLKKLMKDDRYPALSRLGSEDDMFEFFIPGKGRSPSQTIFVSFEEAREIFAIRTKLEHEH